MLLYAYLCPLCNLKTLRNITMILHSYVEQVKTMCRVQEWQLWLSYFLGYFPMMVSDAISCPLYKLNTVRNIIMILHSYVEQVMTMCRVQEWQLSLSYFPSYCPLLFSDAISCPLHNLNTLCDFIMILHSYVEHIWRCVMYKNDNSHLYTLWVIYPWWLKATMPSVLKTIWNILMRLYGSLEEVTPMCLVWKNIAALVFISSPSRPHTPPPPPPALLLTGLFRFRYDIPLSA